MAEQERKAAVTREVVAVDGATLEVLISGAWPPEICTTHPFVPPNGNSVDTVGSSAYLRALAAGGGLAVVNPRGTGGSSPARGENDLTLERLADDLEAVRRSLGVDRWVVAGGSSGADVGLLYALRYPGSLRGLMLLSTGPSGRAVLEDARSLASPRHPSWADAVSASPLRVLPSALPYRTRRWEQLRPNLWSYREAGTALLMLPSDAPRPALSERHRAALEEFVELDVTARLGAIHVPALVVCGRHDDLIPLCRCKALAQIPGTELVVLEESGHGLEQLDLLAAAVRGFLARLGPGA